MDSTDAFQALFEHPGEAQSFADRIVDAIGALIVVLDREGRILRFNAACPALTGWGAA